MRLFISLNLPQEAAEYLISLQKSLPVAEYRFPADFHITLKFLGDVPVSKYDQVVSVLREVAAGFGKTGFLPVVLSEPDVFKDRDMIRSVFVRVLLVEVLLSLQQQLERAFSGLGFKSERNFVPHITLARLKSYDKKTFLDEFGKIETEKKSFRLDAFYLMESFLSPKGSKYIVKEKFCFN